MLELPIEQTAKILDLERRVALLENKLYGHSSPQCELRTLARCYLEAHRAAGKIEPDSAGVWVAQAYLWDVRALVALGRHVNDPFPFRPLLAALDRCVLQGIPEAEAARAHLESVSQDLLNAEGLELVRPRETMSRLRLNEALANLSALRK